MFWGWTCCVGWTSRRAVLLWFSSGSAPIRWMRFWSLHTIGMGGGTTWGQATAMLPWVSTMWPKRWNRFGAGAARSPGSQDNLREAGRSWLLSRIRTGIRSVSYTHLRAHETDSYLVCRLLLEKKKNNIALLVAQCTQ